MKLAHVHIPKTAGNSLRVAYRAAHPQARIARANNPVTMDWVTRSNPANMDMIQGHVPYRDWPTLPGYRWVTVVRDPVERTVSQYNFVMQSTPDEVTEPVSVRMREEGWSFSDYIRTEDSEALAKLYSHVYYLGRDADRPEDHACHALDQMDWVATTDRVDDMLRALGLPVVEKQNVGKPPIYSPTEAELHYLWGRLRQEQVIYQHARELERERLQRGWRLR